MKLDTFSRRTFLKTLTMGAAGLALASCVAPTAPGPGAEPEAEPVVLNALYPSGGPLWADYLDKIAEDFEALHGIELRYSTLPFVQLMDKQLTLVAAGSADVDIFGTHYAQIGRFIEALFPLNEYVARDNIMGSDYVEGSFDAFTGNGNLLAIPYTFDLRALYYRTDLFEAAGIEAPPTTWDELVSTAQALNDPPDLYGYLIVGKGDPALREYSDLLWENGGDFLENGLEPSPPAWNQPAGVEALEWWHDLIYKHEIVPAGTPSYGWEENGQLWTAGQAAMSKQWGPGGSMDPDQSVIVDDFSIAPLVGNKTNITTAVCHGRAINLHSGHPDEAWEFVKYLTSQSVMLDLHASLGARPAHIGALNEAIETAEGISALNLEASLAGAANGYTWPLFPEFSEIQPILWGEIEKVLSNQKSAQEGLDFAAQESEKILANAGLI
jgi:multiple sugar transport system substrate-binding protein